MWKLKDITPQDLGLTRISEIQDLNGLVEDGFWV